MAGDAIGAVERVFRQGKGRVLAGLMRRFGDLGLAEDVLQEACRKALECWPQAGMPDNPAAWLTSVARHAALDHVRRAGKNVPDGDAVLARLPAATAEETHAIADDRLRLLFICCHPALAPEAQVALALRTLCGLSTAEIAHAFGVAEATLSQRLLRARRKIAEARIPFELPPAQDWPQRLAQVLHVIYLVFSEGYCASGGDALLRADLCAEALRLGQLLDSLLPGQPEVQGLLALLLLQASRGAARLSPEGHLLTLEEQDRRLWQGDLIAEGLALLERALGARAPGPYQLQAAVAALHAQGGHGGPDGLAPDPRAVWRLVAAQAGTFDLAQCRDRLRHGAWRRTRPGVAGSPGSLAQPGPVALSARGPGRPAAPPGRPGGGAPGLRAGRVPGVECGRKAIPSPASGGNAPAACIMHASSNRLPTMTNTTHFGYKTVAEDDKVREVAKVFHSVAAKYDVMNDLMSGGLHRLWKTFTIANAGVRPGFKVLDIAGGTGDLSKAFAKQAGPTGEVWLTDINESMLRVGRDRLLNRGLLTPTLLCDAEKLPFPDNYFDRVSVAFGLRNMTHQAVALADMRRVLKPGGKLLVLEFSKVAAPLQKPYDLYSFSVLPWFGQKIAGDAESYRYLAESIRMHPDQETLKTMMETAGLERVQYYNLTAGIAALHTGIKM